VTICGRQAQQFRGLLQVNREQAMELAKLAEVDFVARHLRKTGVGPYLLEASVAERVRHDIQVVQTELRCDELTAMKYLVRGTAGGPEPAADENDRQ
jgi:hypothetical protein